MKEKWFNRALDDAVRLPGTTDENRKGIRTTERPSDRLARVWTWRGAAWYQRDIEIPADWAGKRVTLFLERSKHTSVWLNDSFRGWDNSLSAPQVFDLTKAIRPGKNTLTLLIDNARLPPVGPSHQVDERTQTNWNGVVGRIELRATDPVWIDEVRVFPNAAKREARVQVAIGNITGQAAAGTLRLECTSYNVPDPAKFASQALDVEAPDARNTIEFVYRPGDAVPLWDEFHPALLNLDLTLETTAAGQSHKDTHAVRFGMRDFTRDGGRLLVNGRPVFLRGRLDCANYPLTGYAPMDKESWTRIYSILREWGLNHVRFHSWCPPAAAFEAADELGFFLQPELPNKRSAFNAPDEKAAAIHNIDYLEIDTTETEVTLYDYAVRESDMIFREFGSSPSFTMYTLGNELGRNPAMFELVARFQKDAPHILHAQGSNNLHWNPSLAEGDDFWVIQCVAKDSRPLRGSFATTSGVQPRFEDRPPSTWFDFQWSVEGVPVPLIGHETGQFQVFPDFNEIAKFSGVLEARNYEVFRDKLEKAGMLDQADDFLRASGALSAICYREDIELALRTPGMDGFQLLDIMDFPGQGTAPVGMLNVFMESKGIIEPEDWRRFCSETVPLARMRKLTWTNGETLLARLQVAHHGPADLPDARLAWSLEGSSGERYANGTTKPATLVRGEITEVDLLGIPLAGIESPQALELNVSIEGTEITNSWRVWVYPDRIDTKVPDGVFVTASLSAPETRAHLAAGGKVLLVPSFDRLPHSIEGMFQSDFWSPMFAEGARRSGKPEPPGTLGILCDPAHPALSAFPTSYHSDWQWWHLAKHARPVILDEAPLDFRPIIQVIDTFARNHKLGLLFETKAGGGSLLVCPVDLDSHIEEPAVRQFLHSLLQYMASPEFAPTRELDPGLLDKLLPD